MDNKISLINVDGKDYRLEDINTALKSYSVNLKGAEWIKILKVDDPNILASGNIAVNCYGLRSDTGAKQPLTASLFSLSYGKTKDDELVSNIVTISQSVDEAMAASSGSGGGESGSGGEVGSGGGIETITKLPMPTSGGVETIYFNTSLTVEEVFQIIENANLEWEEESNPSSEFDFRILILSSSVGYCYIYKKDNRYQINCYSSLNGANSGAIFDSNYGWYNEKLDNNGFYMHDNINSTDITEEQATLLIDLMYVIEYGEIGSVQEVLLINEGIEVTSSGESSSSESSSSEGGSSGSAGSGGIFYGLSSVRFSIEEDGTYLEGLFSYPTLTNIYDNLIIDVKIDNNINLSYLDKLRVSYDNGNENLLLEGSKLNIKSAYTLKVSAKWKDLKKLTTDDIGKTVLSFDSILENGMSGYTELLKVLDVNNEDEFVLFQYENNENWIQEFQFGNYFIDIRDELNTKKIEYLIQNVNGFKTKVDIFKFLDNLIAPYYSTVKIEEISIHNFENQVVTVQDKENLDIIQSTAYYLNGELVEYPFKIRRGDTLEIEAFLNQKFEESLLFCVKPVINNNESIISISRTLALPDPFFENVDELTIVNLNYWDLDVPIKVQMYSNVKKSDSFILENEKIDKKVEKTIEEKMSALKNLINDTKVSWENIEFIYEDIMGLHLPSHDGDVNYLNKKIYHKFRDLNDSNIHENFLMNFYQVLKNSETEEQFTFGSPIIKYDPTWEDVLIDNDLLRYSGYDIYLTTFDATLVSNPNEGKHYTYKAKVVNCPERIGETSLADVKYCFAINSFDTKTLLYDDNLKAIGDVFFIDNPIGKALIECEDGGFLHVSIFELFDCNGEKYYTYYDLFSLKNKQNTSSDFYNVFYKSYDAETETLSNVTSLRYTGSSIYAKAGIQVVWLKNSIGNETPYDFLHLLYNKKALYKFDSDEDYVGTFSEPIKGAVISENYNNKISSWKTNKKFPYPYNLPFIIIHGYSHSNILEENCHHITILNTSNLKVGPGVHHIYIDENSFANNNTLTHIENDENDIPIAWWYDENSVKVKRKYNRDTDEWEPLETIEQLDYVQDKIEINGNYSDYSLNENTYATTWSSFDFGTYKSNSSYKKFMVDTYAMVYRLNKELSSIINKYLNILGPKIKNIEAKLNNLDYVEETISSTTNEITLPEETQLIGMIDVIGGNTYTSENLLVFDDVEETTLNGVTYSIKDGIINIKKVTERNQIFIELKNPIEIGTYALETFNSNFGYALYDLNKEASYGFRLNGNSTTTSFKAYYFSFTPTTAISLDTDLSISITPMLVKGSTMPTEFSAGYIGFRHSACTNVHSGSDNLVYLKNYEEQVRGDVTTKIQNNTIILNGISTISRQLFITTENKFLELEKGDYLLTAFIENAPTNNKYWALAFNKGTYSEYFTSMDLRYGAIKFSVTEDNFFISKMYITSDPGNIFRDTRLRFVISKGSKTITAFAPYHNSDKRIPQSIQELDGYGLGIPGTEYYNYIDLERKVFVQRVKGITLDGVNYGVEEYVFPSGWGHITNLITNLRIIDAYPIIDNFNNNYAELYSINDKNIPKIARIDMQNNSKKGIALNNGIISIKLDDSTDNSENNWTQQSYNEYFKNNPISIVYALAEPIETPIENMDEFIQVVPNGTVTFENEYNQNTNNQVTVIKKVV